MRMKEFLTLESHRSFHVRLVVVTTTVTVAAAADAGDAGGGDAGGDDVVIGGGGRGEGGGEVLLLDVKAAEEGNQRLPRSLLVEDKPGASIDVDGKLILPTRTEKLLM